jgi:cellulose synthase/poly-beta-1,6-N-acetylglucosamine synthase-like glycosyltransferase
MIIVEILLAGIAALMAVPAVVLTVEVLAAPFLATRQVQKSNLDQANGSIAVLVPAHNESAGLLPTLEDVKSQLRAGDRLLVVADNCTDDTAAVASSAGAEVTARSDPTKIGKGFALDWGMKYLAASPPDVIIVIDADCRIMTGAIAQLASMCINANRPVQALYLMSAPVGSTINHQVAEFAWRLKNWVRPLGLKALGLPCQLMGTGMAFPWQVARSADISNGFIVEDVKFGLELASAGYPPIFLPSAVVRSTFPTTNRGAEVQRHRWEQGHLTLIIKKAPALLYQAARDRRLDLLALALDLMVPPISLFGLMVLMTAIASAMAHFAGLSLIPIVISAACLIAILVSTSIAWIKYGRDILPASSIVLIVRYCFAKIRLYTAVIFGRRMSRWIRADRG